MNAEKIPDLILLRPFCRYKKYSNPTFVSVRGHAQSLAPSATPELAEVPIPSI
jgi:hypothetical protein